MELFSLENGKFKLNFYDDIIVDLESLFEKIKSLSLQQDEKREFEFEDVKKVQHKFNVLKIDNNSYKLEKFSKNKESQEIELFEKVNLLKEDIIYPIYSEFQVNYLLEKILKVKECTYYLIEENKEVNQINKKDFKDYSGKNIKIKVNTENIFEPIFTRKKDGEKKEDKKEEKKDPTHPDNDVNMKDSTAQNNNKKDNPPKNEKPIENEKMDVE